MSVKYSPSSIVGVEARGARLFVARLTLFDGCETLWGLMGYVSVTKS